MNQGGRPIFTTERAVYYDQGAKINRGLYNEAGVNGRMKVPWLVELWGFGRKSPQQPTHNEARVKPLLDPLAGVGGINVLIFLVYRRFSVIVWSCVPQVWNLNSGVLMGEMDWYLKSYI